jgi:hypothetical protein
VYVVDAQKMSDSEDHAERVPTPPSNQLHTHTHRTARTRTTRTRKLTGALVLGAGGQAYRELHGMLGEGKGRFEKGLAVVLFLINATDPDHVQNTLARLKVLEPTAHAQLFGSLRSKSDSCSAD